MNGSTERESWLQKESELSPWVAGVMVGEWKRQRWFNQWEKGALWWVCSERQKFVATSTHYNLCSYIYLTAQVIFLPFSMKCYGVISKFAAAKTINLVL